MRTMGWDAMFFCEFEKRRRRIIGQKIEVASVIQKLFI